MSSLIPPRRRFSGSPRGRPLLRALAAILACAQALAAPADGVEAVLERARAALRPFEAGPLVQLSGTTEEHGLPASFRWIFDRRGFFRRDLRGTFRGSVGYGGKGLRAVEGHGPPFSPELFEEERWKTVAWVLAGAWALEEGPFEIALDPRETDDAIRLHLRLSEGLLRATLSLDPESAFPTELRFDEAFGGESLILEDWREENGAWLPWAVVWRDGLGREVVEEAQAAGPWTRAEPPWEPVADPRRDWAFRPDASAEVEAKRTESGHLFIRPKIDGREVGWFLLDSGLSTSILRASVADELELGSFGETLLMGFGAGGPRPTVFRQSHAVEVGPLFVDGLVLTEAADMGLADQLLGEPCAGALGWDVFLRALVELDPREGGVRLLDPEQKAPDGVAWSPLALHWRVPYLRGRFAGEREGWFGLDTGAGELTALFHHGAARSLGLLDEAGGQASEARGASGSFQTKPLELAWFELAGQRHAPASVLLSSAEDGEADPYALGFVGAGLLPERRWIFDYSRSRVGFAKGE